MRRRGLVLAAGLVVAAALVAGCGATRTGGAANEELTVFGAASLRNVLTEIEAAYETAHPGTDVVVATDSSAALRAQIEQGAPADVFLSADRENAERLVAAGLGEQVVPFAGNPLAIVAAPASEPELRRPADLARPGVRVIAAGVEAPITRYAIHLLERLATQPGYPADFVDGYERNVRSREDNVRAVVTKIELGEGDAAIVYATDARTASNVVRLPVPPEAEVVATYAATVVRAGKRDAGAMFLDWLVGPEGRANLAAAGFVTPP